MSSTKRNYEPLFQSISALGLWNALSFPLAFGSTMQQAIFFLGNVVVLILIFVFRRFNFALPIRQTVGFMLRIFGIFWLIPILLFSLSTSYFEIISWYQGSINIVMALLFAKFIHGKIDLWFPIPEENTKFICETPNCSNPLSSKVEIDLLTLYFLSAKPLLKIYCPDCRQKYLARIFLITIWSIFLFIAFILTSLLQDINILFQMQYEPISLLTGMLVIFTSILWNQAFPKGNSHTDI